MTAAEAIQTLGEAITNLERAKARIVEYGEANADVRAVLAPMIHDIDAIADALDTMYSDSHIPTQTHKNSDTGPSLA